MRDSTTARALVALASALVAACGPDLPRRQAALEAVLEAERAAHFATDAVALADLLADTLVSVAAGAISLEARADVEGGFAEYFAGASYSAWDDVTPPRIVIAADGQTAVVHRVVRVDRTEPRVGSGRRRVQFQSAWTASYAWRGDRWRMTSVTSTFPPTPSEAAVVVSAARRRVGFTGLGDGDRVLRVRARVEGPGDGFEVVIHSAADGSGRIDFEGDFSAAAYPGGGWTGAASAPSDSIDAVTLSFLRGHESHLMLLAPATRLDGLRVVGPGTFQGAAALELEGRDVLGQPVRLYYGGTDTVPLGYVVTDHARPGSPPVSAHVSSFDEGGLATRAVFRQGAEVFRYEYVERRWLERDPSMFRAEPPPETPGPG